MHSREKEREEFRRMVDDGEIRPELCKKLWNSTDQLPGEYVELLDGWDGFPEAGPGQRVGWKTSYGTAAQILIGIWKEGTQNLKATRRQTA